MYFARSVIASSLPATFGLGLLGVGLLGLLGLGLGGCGDDERRRPPEPTPPPTLPDAEVRLPEGGSDYSPSLATAEPGVDGEIDVDLLMDVDSCAECHADVVEQWRASGHAHSSFDNPWYRAGIEHFREDVGVRESRFCGGCHDPVLMFSGQLDQEVDVTGPAATLGVTCNVCHGITSVRKDGNASYELSTAPIPIPRRGDAASLEAHRARMRPAPIREGTLCGACHRAFVGPDMGNPQFLSGMDDLGAWAASPYAGSHSSRVDDRMREKDCVDCHLPTVTTLRDGPFRRRGEMRSHRMPGGQTALASQLGLPQAEAVRDLLVGVASIDIAAVRSQSGETSLPADGAEVRAGDQVEFDVVVRNLRTGHRFPGGVRDTQDTWIELRVFDSEGSVVSEAGTRYRTGDDATAHRLTTVLLDEAGEPDLTHFVHRFRALAYDHTIGPRDAAVVRYRARLPESIEHFPLRVEARLIHRRHNRSTHELACAAMDTPSGRALAEAQRERRETVIDGCVEQPLTDVASAAVWVGPGSEMRGAEGGADRPLVDRMHDYALGLSHDVSEHLGAAMRPIEIALERRNQSAKRSRAALYVLGAQVLGRQGRVDDALQYASNAETTFENEHPAIWRARAMAYAQVWRWEEAADAWARVAETSPRDTAVFRNWAVAEGSAGRTEQALLAASHGLSLFARDESLLRTQALGLDRLEREEAEAARDAFLAHRRSDAASRLRLLCARNSEFCAQQQVPIPTIPMR